MPKFTQYSCQHKNSKNIFISLAQLIIEVTNLVSDLNIVRTRLYPSHYIQVTNLNRRLFQNYRNVSHFTSYSNFSLPLAYSLYPSVSVSRFTTEGSSWPINYKLALQMYYTTKPSVSDDSRREKLKSWKYSLKTSQIVLYTIIRYLTLSSVIAGTFKAPCIPLAPLEYMWSDNKVCELIAVKVLHTSLLNTTMVAFKVLELVLWNGLQSCCCITPDVISVIKMPFFQYFLYLREQKKSLEARYSE